MVSMTAGGDLVAGVGHDAQFAGVQGSVGGAGCLDGAELIAVAGEDQRRRRDVGEVLDGVSQRGDVSVEEEPEMCDLPAALVGSVIRISPSRVRFAWPGPYRGGPPAGG